LVRHLSPFNSIRYTQILKYSPVASTIKRLRPRRQHILGIHRQAERRKISSNRAIYAKSPLLRRKSCPYVF
jgi:hypothetical protein